MDPQSTSHYNVQDIKEIVGRMLDSLNDNDP